MPFVTPQVNLSFSFESCISKTCNWIYCYRELIYADDIILCRTRSEVVENKPEEWRTAMEDRGLKINRNKTVYLRFNVDGNLDGNSDINIKGEHWKRVNTFKWGVSRKLATLKKMTVTGMNLRDLNVLLLHYPFMSNPRYCLGSATQKKIIPSFFYNCYCCVPYITPFCQFWVNQQERPKCPPSLQKRYPAYA